MSHDLHYWRCLQSLSITLPSKDEVPSPKTESQVETLQVAVAETGVNNRWWNFGF